MLELQPSVCFVIYVKKFLNQVCILQTDNEEGGDIIEKRFLVERFMIFIFKKGGN
jgi:hypothetical protein